MKISSSLKSLSLPLVAALVLGLCSETAFAGATITIINTDGPNEGFNDPTPAAPVGGNTGTTVGQQRLIAFQHAANIWGAALDSNVTIIIGAAFDPLAPNVLGSAGASTLVANFPAVAPFPGPEFADTWYHMALADKRAGYDVVFSSYDIVARFNSNFDVYLGLDGNHGDQPDLVAVLLHEFAHGLGFSTRVNKITGVNPAGWPDVYERKILDTTSGKYFDQMTDAERAASILNTDHIVWDGARVAAELPAVLNLGVPELQINAPVAIAGDYRIGTASFGPTLTAGGITGDVVLVNDGVGATTDACTPLAPGSLAGKIALIDRGTCAFVLKTKVAQDAGAVAVVIADNVLATPPPILGGDDASITIPAVRISLPNGDAIKAQLSGGATVNVTLGVDSTRYAGADPQGRAILYAPNPVDTDLSTSHFDPIASRNLLMEPAINPDLTHSVRAPEDLTLALMRDIGWFPDADVDGYADDVDSCDSSNTAATVVIDGCDSGAPNVLQASGCTISDTIAGLAASAGSHGGFVRAVASYTNDLRRAGILTDAQAEAVRACAAESSLP